MRQRYVFSTQELFNFVTDDYLNQFFDKVKLLLPVKNMSIISGNQS